MYFVNRDVNEKNLRMILNFGHTFAHAIEAKNNYSKNFIDRINSRAVNNKINEERFSQRFFYKFNSS